ncbi:hypothetical protein ABOM_007557 [Aspergillus bombycis]|uniref:NmrA-like domain-containing protein n=1 Tax=Aspergillus bombycis TaxID=109264 RepID=A0A1F7ZWL8_9EURO|nr:hypothetical protein ABOM_007557 [Aspergillus bombycis]OGM43846.1 hypothetical protein ABOM_007557 [Aspergillus bombycis]
MATIAVAGGTDGLGLTIVEALAVHGGHDVSGAELEKTLPFRLIAVDYSDIDSLVDVLELNNIGTVIATINALGNSLPERNLVRAAEKSSKTTRFIPSTFACFNYPARYAETSILAKAKFEVIEELRKTSLIYTSIISGWFVDYYGTPLLQSHAHRFPMFIDIANKQAAIPGSGNEPVAFTRLIDIARYVVRALDLSSWPKESYIIGDRITLREFVQLAEAARGSKFQVTYDSKEDLDAGRLTDLPCYSDFYSALGREAASALFREIGVWMAAGELDVKPSFSLNEAFPDIKPMTVREYLDLSWRV